MWGAGSAAPRHQGFRPAGSEGKLGSLARTKGGKRKPFCSIGNTHLSKGINLHSLIALQFSIIKMNVKGGLRVITAPEQQTEAKMRLRL